MLHGDDILALQKVVRRVPVSDLVFQFAKRITRLSRPGTPEAAEFANKWLTWGAGPRASMNLILAAKAHAVLRGQQPRVRRRRGRRGPADPAAPADRELHRPERGDHGGRRDQAADQDGRQGIRRLTAAANHARATYSPEFCRAPRPLGIKARSIVEGLRVGDHKSPFRGFSVEFVQHREYVPGDDIRHIDWKSYGRSERYTIKQYEQETNFAAHILLDGSKSMEYGDGAANKLEYAKLLAATLAYVVVKQRDSVALNVFDADWRVELPASSSMANVNTILHTLEDDRAGGEDDHRARCWSNSPTGSAGGGWCSSSRTVRRGGQRPEGLKHLRFQGHDVTVFHVLHPDEVDFPFTGNVKFDGLELPEEIKTRPHLIRPAYQRVVQDYLTELRGGCDAYRVDYVRMDTSKPLEHGAVEVPGDAIADGTDCNRPIV